MDAYSWAENGSNGSNGTAPIVCSRFGFLQHLQKFCSSCLFLVLLLVAAAVVEVVVGFHPAVADYVVFVFTLSGVRSAGPFPLQKEKSFKQAE